MMIIMNFEQISTNKRKIVSDFFSCWTERGTANNNTPCDTVGLKRVHLVVCIIWKLTAYAAYVMRIYFQKGIMSICI
jgi:hypothetical protein